MLHEHKLQILPCNTHNTLTSSTQRRVCGAAFGLKRTSTRIVPGQKKNMSFDNTLAVAGGFGKFQLWLIFLTIPARANLPLNYLLNNFIAAVPSHHCNIGSLDHGGVFRNLSQDEKLRVSIPVREDGKPDSCVMFAKPQYDLLLQNSSNATDLPTVPCQQGWVYDNSTFRDTLVTEVNLTCLIVH